MLQTAEVAEIRLCRVDELRAEMLTSPERFTPWFLGRARDVGLFG
jgi:isopentenyldiphosphate isomerase